MIFTIGNSTAYRQHIAENGDDAKKIGQRGPGVFPMYPDGYPGGSVWRTQQEAQQYRDTQMQRDRPEWARADFEVFGVDADWDADTYQYKDDSFHSLKHDAPLVLLQGDRS